MITEWEQRGIEQGIEQGIVQGQRRALLVQMRRKFGDLPVEIVATVERIEVPERLDALSERVLTAATLEEMHLSDG